MQKAGSLREQGDALLQGAPKIELLAQSCAEGDSQFGDFGLEGFIALESSGHMALEHVPDLHEQFARDGGYGDGPPLHFPKCFWREPREPPGFFRRRDYQNRR